jgi:hypothetical protein
VVVGLTLLTLLITAGFGALHMVGRSWETGAARTDASERVQAAREFLRQRLAQAVPLMLGKEDTLHVAFEGLPQGLRCVVPAPPYVEGIGLYELAVRAHPSGREQALLVSLAPIDPTQDRFAAGPVEWEAVLLDGADGLRFEYFGTPPPLRAADWRPEWPARTNVLPLVVRVSLRLPGQGGEELAMLLPIRVAGGG